MTGADVAVVGPGALGCLLAARFAAAGERVLVVDHRPDRAAWIEHHGVRLDGAEPLWLRVAATAAPRDAGEVPLVLLAVKSYSVEAALAHARPLFGQATDVVGFENGLGHVEAMAAAVGAEPVLAASTTQGATLVGPGWARHEGGQETLVAELKPRPGRLDALVARFSRAGLEAKAEPSLGRMLWSKLLVSAAVNPLSALLRCENGALVARASARALLQEVVREAAAVARARGVRLDGDEAVERAEAVCKATARNRSSMLQDVLAGRPTEVDAILGALLKEAQKARTQAPRAATLLALVRGLTAAD